MVTNYRCGPLSFINQSSIVLNENWKIINSHLCNVPTYNLIKIRHAKQFTIFMLFSESFYYNQL